MSTNYIKIDEFFELKDCVKELRELPAVDCMSFLHYILKKADRDNSIIPAREVLRLIYNDNRNRGLLKNLEELGDERKKIINEQKAARDLRQQDQDGIIFEHYMRVISIMAESMNANLELIGRLQQEQKKYKNQ